MAKHIHIHVGTKTKDAVPRELSEAKALLVRAVNLLEGRAIGINSSKIQGVAKTVDKAISELNSLIREFE